MRKLTRAPHRTIYGQVLAPILKKLNGVEILLQYGGLTANVCFYEVLRCALATQVSSQASQKPMLLDRIYESRASQHAIRGLAQRRVRLHAS